MLVKRRDILKGGLALGGQLLLPLPTSWAQPSGEDHYFLQIVLDGGMDPHYLFDSRPKEMTAKEVQHSYYEGEPTVWQGNNGQSCLAAPMVKPLLQFKEDLSIVNGVLMAHNFDGHLQNLNYLFSSNAFGGTSFVPHLNVQKSIVDAMLFGGFNLRDLKNHDNVVPLDVASGVELIERVRYSTEIETLNPAIQQIRKRMAANSQGKGRFSEAIKLMSSGYKRAPLLAKTLGKISLDKINAITQKEEMSEEAKSVHFLAEVFNSKTTSSAIMFLNVEQLVDAHDTGSAQAQPTLYSDVATKVADVLDTLKSIPMGDGQSLFDKTTVMFTSEFGRTMRQQGLKIAETGTNHNPLSNSIVFAGKGIKGGQVIGASDFATSDEQLSKVHLTIDPNKEKLMGRPFDLLTGQVKLAKPETFDQHHYLNMPIIANTLMYLFNVPPSKFQKIGRDTRPAPTLKQLLS